jgi:hypothetical protein
VPARGEKSDFQSSPFPSEDSFGRARSCRCFRRAESPSAHLPAFILASGFKVLLCPEDMTQVAVGKEMFRDKLPDDVRKRVVWRDTFWLTDEALSVYVRSAGLFGSEMHSPIMAVGNGVPAIVCRLKEQTSKGFM